MKIVCSAKEGNRQVMTVFIDDEPWREIHSTIFGRIPLCQTVLSNPSSNSSFLYWSIDWQSNMLTNG